MWFFVSLGKPRVSYSLGTEFNHNLAPPISKLPSWHSFTNPTVSNEVTVPKQWDPGVAWEQKSLGQKWHLMLCFPSPLEGSVQSLQRTVAFTALQCQHEVKILIPPTGLSSVAASSPCDFQVLLLQTLWEGQQNPKAGEVMLPTARINDERTATHSLSLQLFILKAALEQQNCRAEGTGTSHALLSPLPWPAFPVRGFMCSNCWTCVKASPRAQFTLRCQQFPPPESAFCFYHTLPPVRIPHTERDSSKTK